MTRRGESAGRPPVPGPGQPWTVMVLVQWSAAYLQDKGVSSGRLDAEHLLADTLQVPRLQLYLQFDRPLEPLELAAFKARLQRRARREPLQYILGRTGFRELELLTDPRALIPRPETEGLVELVLEWARSRKGDATVLEVGCGSGAIALALASEGSFTRIVATDVSTDALALTRENADRLSLAGRVELRHGATYGPVPEGERYDVIVSNPPYVTTEEMADLEPEVGHWEPRGALEAGPLGLDVIRELVAGAQARLRPGGLLALEMGAGQGERVLELVQKSEGLRDAEVKKDLAGRDRYVVAHRSAPNVSESDEA